MPVTRKYQCPDCEGIFPVWHRNSDEPPPDYCALCGGYMGVDPRPMPSMPNISRGATRSADDTYRQMEKASDARVAMAESMLPAESGGDMGVMKVTDLSSGQAAAPLAPPSGAVGGLADRASMMGHIQRAATGPAAGVGAATMSMLKQSHAQTAAGVTAKGRIR